MQQQISESLLLTLLGGGLGLLLAFGLSEVLLAFEPGIWPRKEAVAIDAPVLWLALAASLVAGVAFGLVSALHRSSSLSGALKERDSLELDKRRTQGGNVA